MTFAPMILRGSCTSSATRISRSIAAGATHDKSRMATPAGGVPEIIQDRETGLLVPDGDDAALAPALAELLADATLRDRLIRTGRERVVDRFAPGAAAEGFLALYREVAGVR